MYESPKGLTVQWVYHDGVDGHPRYRCDRHLSVDVDMYLDWRCVQSTTAIRDRPWLILTASILLPVLLFTAVISLGILGGIMFLFLAHRFWLHLRAASETTSGEFRPTLDSLRAALADFGTETIGRTGIDPALTPLKKYMRLPGQGAGPQIRWQFPTAATQSRPANLTEPVLEEKLFLSDTEGQTPTPTIRRMVEQRIIREAEDAQRARIEQQLRQLEQQLQERTQ